MTARNDREQLKKFVVQCTDKQLLEFLAYAAQFGALELVRKLMLVWLGSSKITTKKMKPVTKRVVRRRKR